MRPTCQECGQFLPSAGCQCGHVEACHDISRAGLRIGCTAHDGPVSTPCGCRQYEETT